jgi:uncharacterized membrane protein HdeD (DUF308 family)
MTTKKAGKVTDSLKPWSKNAPWWVMAIEAVVAIGLGIYVLSESARATNAISLALAIFLLVDGLLSLFSSLRGRSKTFGAVRGGIGLLAGVVLLMMNVFNFGDATIAGWIIGLALVIGGFVGLLSRLFESGRPISWISVIITLLMMAIGGVYLYSVILQTTGVLSAIGWLLLALGLALAAYAAYVWNEGRKAFVL